MSAIPFYDPILSGAENQPAADPQLKVFVLYTGMRRTSAALRNAAVLAAGLAARIEVIILHVVPYPLPIEAPPVSASFLTNRVQALIEKTAIQAGIQICMCRDRSQAVAWALPPGSIVIIAAHRRWSLGKDYRLGRWLRANGHRVIFVDAQSSIQESSHGGHFLLRHCIPVFRRLQGLTNACDRL